MPATDHALIAVRRNAGVTARWFGPWHRVINRKAPTVGHAVGGFGLCLNPVVKTMLGRGRIVAGVARNIGLGPQITQVPATKQQTTNSVSASKFSPHTLQWQASYSPFANHNRRVTCFLGGVCGRKFIPRQPFAHGTCGGGIFVVASQCTGNATSLVCSSRQQSRSSGGTHPGSGVKSMKVRRVSGRGESIQMWCLRAHGSGIVAVETCVPETLVVRQYGYDVGHRRCRHVCQVEEQEEEDPRHFTMHGRSSEKPYIFCP